MKKTIAITSALAAASSLATAEIKINEFLSFAGFVDMSYSHTDIERGTANGSDNSFAVDEVEIDWLFNFGKVTAQVDLEYQGDNNRDNDDGVEVEQAFVNYDLGNGLTITAGRYESGLGLEAKEPTGLYQYSTAYDFGSTNNGGGADDTEFGDANFLPQYAQGVKLTKVSGDNVYHLSVQDESFDNDGGRLGGDVTNPRRGNDDSSYSIEAGASIALSDELTWFIGGAQEDADTGDTLALDTHLVYQTGAWTFGGEIAYLDSDADRFSNTPNANTVSEAAVFALGAAEAPGANITIDGGSIDYSDSEAIQAMVMANYAYSDCCSVTARISYHDSETTGSGTATSTGATDPLDDFTGEAFSGTVDLEYLKYTLAHNYAVTDNLAIITEISYIDGDASAGGQDADYEALVGAVEVLFTF